jgi:hypothetical protein
MGSLIKILYGTLILSHLGDFKNNHCPTYLFHSQKISKKVE